MNSSDAAVTIGASTPYVVDDAKSFRVRRDAYTSSEVLRAEERAIFDHAWLYVGHASEIPSPSDFVTRTVARRPLIVCRDMDGNVRVHINSCRHRGAEVCRDESGNSRVFRCFYQAWSYSTDGQLMNVPDRAGYPNDMPFDDFGLLAPPRVDTYRDFVFVSFDDSIVDLPEYLGDAAEYLDLVAEQSETGMEIVGGTHKYYIAANWKLLVENSLDGYHLLPLHKSYFDFVADSGDEVRERRETQAADLGNGHALIVDRAPWGRPTARWARSMGENVRGLVEERRKQLDARVGKERAATIAETDRNLLIFPDPLINDIMAVTIRVIRPIGPDQMQVTGWALAPNDDGEELRKASLRNFVSFLGPGGFATPDDVEALESVQRGLASFPELPWSDMSRGIPDSATARSDGELQARAFWREWDRRIGQRLTTGLPHDH